MTTPLARLLDAIPVVATTAERTSRFPSPYIDQRVQNREVGAIQRYDASLGWVSEFAIIAPALTVTETTLVSGVDASLVASIIKCTLTAARVVGVPLNPTSGQRLTFAFLQDGTGGWAVTWNAVFKVNWSNTSNTANKRSSITVAYDGTNWIDVAAQSTWV